MGAALSLGCLGVRTTEDVQISVSFEVYTLNTNGIPCKFPDIQGIHH